jgi:hypothetical protein
MNGYGFLDTAFIWITGLVPTLHQRLIKNGNDRLAKDPSAYRDFCDNVDARVDLTKYDLNDDDFNEIIKDWCVMMPAMIPYKESLKNFMVNKYKRDKGTA